MQKIGLHIDAMIVIVILFMASFGLNLYQRYQYSDLLEAHSGLQMNQLGMDFSLSVHKALLEKCESHHGTD